MPRNDASSTAFEKNVRYSTCAGNQRMDASSRKSNSRLMRNRSPPALLVERLPAGAVGDVMPESIMDDLLRLPPLLVTAIVTLFVGYVSKQACFALGLGDSFYCFSDYGGLYIGR